MDTTFRFWGYYAAMELGLTTFAEITDPDVSPGGRLRQVVAEARLADEVGLEVYGIGEHHRPDMAASAPEIVLATITGCTKTIKLSSAVIVLSSADPVRVFQNFVTLDLVSGGRAELMVGRGSFTESFPGLPMALAIIGGRPVSFTPLVELYRKALEYGEHDLETPLAVHSHGYVSTDERAARDEFLPAYRQTFAKIGRERGWPPMSDAAVEDLIGPEGALFFGRPETVADKIIRLHELMHIDRFELHVSHVDHAKTMRSIELFGTEVAPLVREELAARSPAKVP
jgi:alkanesulfonate monooxygenase SsuD/methylene tetrahydromethanopterin reductase-like flavin-dependent oxidoreductase (luciferase family)